MASCRKVERTIFSKLPFDIIDPSENDKSGYVEDLVSVGPKKFAFPVRYKQHALDVYNFEARPDDIYLVGVQRTGTTLTCELVWLIENNLDFEGAAKEVLDYRFPHIDFAILGTTALVEKFIESRKDNDEVVEAVRKYLELDLEGLAHIKGKRFIRSHLPLSLLSPHIFEVGAKIIYCARNPKDVIVSLYNLYADVTLNMPNKSFQSRIDNFKNDSAYGYPLMEHVKEGWDRRNDKNFLFLFYEDTIKDKRATIQKVADFLGKKLSKDQIDILEAHLSIEKFKENKSVNWDHLVQLGLMNDKTFIRKGKTGGWKTSFDEKQEKEFDETVKEKLKGMDLIFPNVSR